MKNLHIENSYNTWSPRKMRSKIFNSIYENYHIFDSVESVLNRTLVSLYVEWWLHNIGYYVTKPFCGIESIRKINLRCKDVDLEEWI